MASHDPAELPTTVGSVIWFQGHPFVLDGEPGCDVPGYRWWVGIVDRTPIGQRKQPWTYARSDIIERGFVVLHVANHDEDGA